MNNLVPDGWSIQRQGNIADFSNGKAYKLTEWEKEGTPVIRLQNLTGSGKKFYYSNMKLPDRQYCHRGDLLYMWSATFGAKIWNGEKAIYHYHIWKITCDEVNLTKLYLYQLLDFKTQEWLNKSNGMGILHITKGGMEDLPLLLPPLIEQRKIAKILYSVDEVIEKIKAKIDKLKDLKTGMMQELLTNGIGHAEFKESSVGKIPSMWRCVKMNAIAKVTDGAHHTPTYTNSGVPFLRVTDLKNKNIFKGKIKYVSKEEHKQLCKRCKPEKNDILYSKNGTIGIPRLVDWDEEFSIFVSLALIKITSKEVTPAFLSLFMDSPIVREQIRKRSKQGTVLNLHLEEIREFDIPLPDIEEQIRISSALQSIINNINVCNEKLTSYKNTKKALMQDLLKGKVRVHTESTITEVVMD